jgi:hypothetical protein
MSKPKDAFKFSMRAIEEFQNSLNQGVDADTPDVIHPKGLVLETPKSEREAIIFIRDRGSYFEISEPN